MLIRIVRLTLAPDRLSDFLMLFDRIAGTIRSMDGCESLELMQDLAFPNIVTTYSCWKDEVSLETYRQTDFFKSIWQETRKMFAAPALANSYRVLRPASP